MSPKRSFTSAACAAVVFGIAGLWTATASATTFVATTTVTDNIANPDISYASSGLNADISIGSPLTITDFIVASFFNSAFTSSPDSITASFVFTTPPGSIADTGTITGTKFTRIADSSVSIIWSDPIDITFSNNGAILQIDLANTSYTCTGSGNSCTNETFDIGGTFTLINAGESIAATPLPGALPLFATGIAALGLIGWRRKRTNAAAIVAG
jgi:hypothetical protein